MWRCCFFLSICFSIRWKMNAVAKVFFNPLLLATNCAKRESRARTRLSATSLHRLLNSATGQNSPLSQIVHSVNKVFNNDDIHLTIETGEIRRAVKSRLGGRYREGHTCITTYCPSCAAAAAKRRPAVATGSNGSNMPFGDLGELQINLKTGYTFCTSCFHQAPWPRFYSYLTAIERCDTKSSEKMNRKDSESSRVKHVLIWMPLIPLCFLLLFLHSPLRWSA